MTILSNRKRDSELISDELAELLTSIGTTRKIKAHSYLFREGDEASELYLITSGRYQISKLTSDGKELYLRICKEKDIIGELILYAYQPKYMLSALSLTDSEVMAVKVDVLEQKLLKNPELTFEFMRWFSIHVRRLQTKIADLVINGKKGALYSTLIRLSNSYGIKTKEGVLIDLHLTNNELAKFCSATRESINRMLSDLRKKKVISIQEDGKILIHDLEFFRSFIGCDQCPIEVCNID
ncbi:Crp/Fnr family transcriptional regulator [Bacillus carboniphilus]|uniref:Crp/Fnr family transcriptional regulator n=1 Tax=Bacillus carboniphilus TaxID=86663 RepID=A0ABY9JXN4_9BACI|nr:Crp/Fnr family transcriptional regulator [Bacillus carboniphilus]WLR42380.1 Crp/Fnr family transcriptional regulator [Bacillus carboniphilus]